MNTTLTNKLHTILSHFGSKTGRAIMVNTIGNYLNIAFALFFVLLLTRTMERVEYGVMTVLLNISYLLANIMEFGVTATIYSNIPGLHAQNSRRNELLSFIKTTISYQSGLASIVIVLLIVAFPTLDAVFFKTGADHHVLAITAISVLFFIWQNTLLNMFFAMKKFLTANIWLNTSNVIKTIVVLLLYPLNLANLTSIIFVFGILGPAIFIGIAIWFYRTSVGQIISNATISRKQLRIEYTLTNFIASQFFNLGMRMDLFILSYFGLRTQVADYGLAQKIMLTIISTVVSITQVLSPKYALVKTQVQALRMLRQSALYLSIPTICFSALLFLPDWVFHVVFTPKFVETPMLTRLSGLAYILFSVGQVFALFHLYTFRKPQVLLVSNVLYFIFVTLGCFILVPYLQAYAGPLVLGIGLLAVTIGQGLVFWSYFKKMPTVALSATRD